MTDPDSHLMKGRVVRAGLQRAGSRQRAPDRARRRDQRPSRSTSHTRTDDHRDRRDSSRRLTSPRCSPTPGTGTSSTWTRSSLTASGPDPARRRREASARLERRRYSDAHASSDAARGIPKAPIGRAGFPHTKYNRQFTRFHRRGRAAVRMEWRLLMLTHNLTKLRPSRNSSVSRPTSAPASCPSQPRARGGSTSR